VNDRSAPKTGEIFSKKLFRGTGRSKASSVYTNKSLGAIFGKVGYWAISEAVAKKFGPNIESRVITLENPLVLDSDLALGDLVGATTLPPNPTLEDLDKAEPLPSKAREQIQALHKAKKLLKAKGNDGVIVWLESDIGNKHLRAWFRDTQIIEL